ncbi:MAG: hypothetical protein AB7U71_13375 [Comamonas sp.]|uniref:hypothetical protein n=1 Tax=Comamonas thiooxydans TaxID=363952 RepID=UPI000B05B0CA|nr:hypothetical protein [Comamonas thiooxydans]
MHASISFDAKVNNIGILTFDLGIQKPRERLQIGAWLDIDLMAHSPGIGFGCWLTLGSVWSACSE